LKRTVKLNREKEKVEIRDAVELQSTPASYQQVFMTVCTVEVSDQGKILLTGNEGRQLTLQYDERKWQVQLEEPSFEGMEYESFNKKWDGRKITRIILSQQTPQSKGQYLFTFTPVN
jgi:DNA integrity scanning protein DisA with diadenylate cyclase activity